MLDLRWYQSEAIQAIYDYFTNNTGNPLLAIPTGAGKSLIIAEFMRTAFQYYGAQNFIMCTHVKELIQQNYEEIMNQWPDAPVGIASAGLGRRELDQHITFGGVKTLFNLRDQISKTDIIFVDEAQLVSSVNEAQYTKLIQTIVDDNPLCKVVGLTATPYRLGQGLLTQGKVFTDIAYDVTSYDNFNRLVDEGYLCNLIPKKVSTQIDIDGIRTVNGDLSQSGVSSAVTDKITERALEESRALAWDRGSWIVFAPGVSRVEYIKDRLNYMGVAACHVHSKMQKKERDYYIEAFKQGRYRAMVNDNILAVGFNHKPLDCMIDLSPTISTGRWIQRLGRLTRVFPGKRNGLVLDYSGNSIRLGPINDPVIPKPPKPGKKRGGAPQLASIKLCPACDTYNSGRAAYCVNCGVMISMTPRVAASAGTADVVRRQSTVVDYQVTHTTYSKYTKNNKDILLVTYYAGVNRLKHYVLIEHSGRLRAEAYKFISEATGGKIQCPTSVDMVLHNVHYFRPARAVRAKVDGVSTEILKVIY